MTFRREFLRCVPVAALIGVSGCTSESAGGAGTDPATNSGDTTSRSVDTAQRTESTQSTESAPNTATPRGTNTCEEQHITSDIGVWNDRTARATVSVEVRADPPVSDPPYFSATYTLEAGEREAEKRIYTDADPDRHEYELIATSGNQTKRIGVSDVVEDPSLRTTDVKLVEDDIRLIPGHSDPGEGYNPNCY